MHKVHTLLPLLCLFFVATTKSEQNSKLFTTLKAALGLKVSTLYEFKQKLALKLNLLDAMGADAVIALATVGPGNEA